MLGANETGEIYNLTKKQMKQVLLNSNEHHKMVAVFASSQLELLKKGWSRASFAVSRSDGLYLSKPYKRSANPDLELSTCFATISCKVCEHFLIQIAVP